MTNRANRYNRGAFRSCPKFRGANSLYGDFTKRRINSPKNTKKRRYKRGKSG